MNILFTICARAGSKGVKNKNIKMFLNYPLLYHTLSSYNLFVKETVLNFDNIEIAINSDSEILQKQCSQTNIPVYLIKRKMELGGDHVAKADVISDTLQEVEHLTNKQYDIICDLDLTSPLRTVHDIEGCIKLALDTPEASVSYSITNARRLPFFNMVKKNSEGFLETIIPTNFTTRQECPVCYDMNASIYAYKRKPLLNTVNEDVFKKKCIGWVMKDTAVLDIDSEEDFELLQVLAGYFYSAYPDYGLIYNNIESIIR